MGLSAKEIMGDLAKETNLLREVDEIEREKLQQTLLTMLEDITEACSKLNIKPVLVGGSALGAVRHGGFIPWDDDVDLGMLRPDWEKFKNGFEKTLGVNYILESPNYNDCDTKTIWGKIYKKNTILEEIQDINMPFCKGIFIDVFIYENVSSNALIRKFDAIASDFLKGVATSQVMYKYPNKLMSRFMNSTLKTRSYYFFRRSLGFFFSWCSHKAFCNWYDRFISRHTEDCGLVTSPLGRKNYMKEIIRSESWNNLRKVKFEGINCWVFSNVEDYLILLYGRNYMQIPPIEKREKHFIVNLKF